MRELREPFKTANYILGIVLVLWSFALLTVFPLDPLILRTVHLALVMMMVFIAFPATKRSPMDRPTYIDLAWCAVAVAIAAYILSDWEQFLRRISQESPSQADLIVGVMLAVAVIELVRRVGGMSLVIVALVTIAYALFGNFIPGPAGHRGYPLWRIIATLFSEDGILGSPVQMTATFVVLFVTFGSFLTRSGVSDFINDFALALLGGQRGGPAKVAVAASCLFGMVSGNGAANVATVGTITIPMMKKIGYTPEFAAAVEATASAGGQFMPPVLSAVAFVMVALTNIPYRDFVIISVFPALLYYAYVYFNVDFEAGNLELRGLPRTELPPLWPIVKRQIFLLAPVPVLFYTLVVQQAPVVTSVLWSILASLLAGYANSFLNKRKYMGPREYADAVYGGSVVIRITAVVGVAGIIIAMIMMTGIGVKLGGLLYLLTGGNLLLSLVIAAVLCTILGCGMPALPAYVITVAVMAPVLQQLGLSLIVTHFFIFFYSSLSTITPPVAISVFTASGIAGSEPMRTGWRAVKIAGIGWLVPFLLVYSPRLGMVGSPPDIALAVIPVFIGGYAMARGLAYARVPKLLRVMYASGGFLSLVPVSAIIGIVVTACAALLERRALKQKALADAQELVEAT